MLEPADYFDARILRQGEFPEARRFDSWRVLLNKWLLEADVKQTSDRPFRSSGLLRTLPDVRFGWGAIGESLTRRTRDVVAKDDDDLFLLVNLEGTIVASRRDDEVKLAPGEAYLMPCSQTGAFQLGSGVKLICVRARHSAIAPLVRNLYDTGGPIPRDNEGLGLLIRYVRMLDNSTPLTTPEARALVTRHIQDLFALTLGLTGDRREIADSVGAVRRKAIEAYIERNLSRPNLSLDSVARHFRLSQRSVQRVFEIEGTSFTAFLLAKRLDRAHAALAMLQPAAQIGAIALACGFGDISYFNRAFRSRYHATPSDVRDASLGRR